MLRDVALGTELPRAGKSLPRRVLLQEQEDECRDEQDGDGEHAERALPVRDVVVATRKVPMIEAVLPKIS